MAIRMVPAMLSIFFPTKSLIVIVRKKTADAWLLNEEKQEMTIQIIRIDQICGKIGIGVAAKITLSQTIEKANKIELSDCTSDPKSQFYEDQVSLSCGQSC